MARFTNDQRILKELMERLIEIHYMEDLLDLRKKDHIRRPLSVLRKPLSEINDSLWDDLVGPAGIRTLFKGVQNVNYDQIEAFNTIMNALQSIILNGESNHFALVRVENDVQTALSELPETTKFRLQEEADTVVNWKIVMSTVDKMAATAMKGQGTKISHLGKVRLSCDIFRIYYVEPLSKFAVSLLATEPREERPNSFLPIFFPTWSSFIQMVRSIILNFYFAFDGFQRLKACQQCQKLLFEKKEGYRKFCSAICRKKWNEQSDPKDKRLCRDRQNAWIRNRISGRNPKAQNKGYSYYTVQKLNCEKCLNTMQSGKCNVLIQRNINQL